MKKNREHKETPFGPQEPGGYKNKTFWVSLTTLVSGVNWYP